MVAPSHVMGLSPSGARELSHRRLPSLSPSVLAQPSSSEMGESSEEHESSDDVDCRQLLKDYREVQVVLSSTRLNSEMCGELDASCDAPEASMTEFSKMGVD